MAALRSCAPTFSTVPTRPAPARPARSQHNNSLSPRLNDRRRPIRPLGVCPSCRSTAGPSPKHSPPPPPPMQTVPLRALCCPASAARPRRPRGVRCGTIGVRPAGTPPYVHGPLRANHPCARDAFQAPSQRPPVIDMRGRDKETPPRSSDTPPPSLCSPIPRHPHPQPPPQKHAAQLYHTAFRPTMARFTSERGLCEPEPDVVRAPPSDVSASLCCSSVHRPWQRSRIDLQTRAGPPSRRTPHTPQDHEPAKGFARCKIAVFASLPKSRRPV